MTAYHPVFQVRYLSEGTQRLDKADIRGGVHIYNQCFCHRAPLHLGTDRFLNARIVSSQRFYRTRDVIHNVFSKLHR